MANSKRHGAPNRCEPLSCVLCDEDLLETGFGNVVFFVTTRHGQPAHYLDAYWACKHPCDRFISTAFGGGAGQMQWKSVGELTNPLEHERFFWAASVWTTKNRVSATAAKKIGELRGKLRWVAGVTPTEEHEAEFRMLREMEGI